MEQMVNSFGIGLRITSYLLRYYLVLQVVISLFWQQSIAACISTMMYGL
jgi:hypothetical protein